MKKILLSILFFMVASTAHALTPIYPCTSGGNWSGSIWVLLTASQAACTSPTTNVTGDEAIFNAAAGNVTVTASVTTAGIDETGYTGTLTINSGQTLTVSAGDPCNLGSVMSAGSATTSIIAVGSGGVTLLSTPTGSTFPLLDFTNSATLTSGGFNWPGNFTQAFTTVTLSGNADILGTYTLTGTGGSQTITGASLTVNTFNANTTSGNSLTFQTGKTLTITNAMAMYSPFTLTSSTTTPFNLNYTGTLAGMESIRMTYSYVNASGSTYPIYNYYGGTLTGTTNITNVTAANLGGSQGYTYGG
jgi:hypothetical protein